MSEVQMQEEDPLAGMTPDALKSYIAQMKKEKDIDRAKTSEGCEHILNYCEERMGEDPLVVGIPTKMNPFIEKSSCALL